VALRKIVGQPTSPSQLEYTKTPRFLFLTF
jgi:hypothetical protein